MKLRVLKRGCYVETAGARYRVTWNGDCFGLGSKTDSGWFYQGLFIDHRPDSVQPELRGAFARLLVHLRASGQRVSRSRIRLAH